MFNTATDHKMAFFPLMLPEWQVNFATSGHTNDANYTYHQLVQYMATQETFYIAKYQAQRMPNRPHRPSFISRSFPSTPFRFLFQPTYYIPVTTGLWPLAISNAISLPPTITFWPGFSSSKPIFFRGVLKVPSIDTTHHSLLLVKHLILYQDAVILVAVVSIVHLITFVPSIQAKVPTPKHVAHFFIWTIKQTPTHHDSHFNHNEQIDNINHLDPYALTEEASYDYMASKMTPPDNQEQATATDTHFFAYDDYIREGEYLSLLHRIEFFSNIFKFLAEFREKFKQLWMTYTYRNRPLTWPNFTLTFFSGTITYF